MYVDLTAREATQNDSPSDLDKALALEYADLARLLNALADATREPGLTARTKAKILTRLGEHADAVHDLLTLAEEAAE